MSNNSKFDGSTPGYNPTSNPIPKSEQSAPAMKDGDTYEAEARGNIKLASEQKNLQSRQTAKVPNSRSGNKYGY
jgi:hypothetical protein